MIKRIVFVMGAALALGVGGLSLWEKEEKDARHFIESCCTSISLSNS